MRLFRSPFIKAVTSHLRAATDKDRAKLFTSFLFEEPAKKKETTKKSEAQEEDEGINKNIINTGRAWKADELRLKSNEDLHKLWYVLLREKNALMADACVYTKIAGEEMPRHRRNMVEKSMARLQFVVRERKHIRQNYRQFLENQYTLQMKEKLQDQYNEERLNQKISPPISYALLRAKYDHLQSGKDNFDYIDKNVLKTEQKEQFKKYLREKYAYGKKKIINTERLTEEEVQKLDKDKYILTFKNSIEEQLKSGKTHVFQEEILRAHIKNWKVLDLKQRRVVLDHLNIRRSRDAKSAFVKELNLLAQKIAYEEKNVAPTA
jgi:large subunit ribosomal protein L47